MTKQKYIKLDTAILAGVLNGRQYYDSITQDYLGGIALFDFGEHSKDEHTIDGECVGARYIQKLAGVIQVHGQSKFLPQSNVYVKEIARKMAKRSAR